MMSTCDQHISMNTLNTPLQARTARPYLLYEELEHLHHGQGGPSGAPAAVYTWHRVVRDTGALAAALSELALHRDRMVAEKVGALGVSSFLGLCFTNPAFLLGKRISAVLSSAMAQHQAASLMLSFTCSWISLVNLGN